MSGSTCLRRPVDHRMRTPERDGEMSAAGRHVIAAAHARLAGVVPVDVSSELGLGFRVEVEGEGHALSAARRAATTSMR
ncbi:hypothetical protein [Georgenia sp.]